MRTIMAISTLAVVIFSAPAAYSFNECAEFKDRSGRITAPAVPTCVDYIIKSSSDYEKQTCLNDLNTHQLQVSAYRSCLQAEVNDAIKNHNDAIREFDCRAGARCY